MALMASEGELGPMPDCAIFADTGWEPKAVYEHLDRLEKALPFPVYRVRDGDIRKEAIDGYSDRAGKFAPIPWHLRKPDGSKGIGRRECTQHYKLRPIRRKVVDLQNGKRKKGATEMWVGISTDEALRMKPSRVQYIRNRWPLIENGLSRADCRSWLSARGWDVPKSSCIGCPFHSRDQWLALTPEEMADAISVDEAIRHQAGSKGEQFMHYSLKPLSEVKFVQRPVEYEPELLNNECEGMCGV